jgi:alpha 1,2-mannosyltransferase
MDFWRDEAYSAFFDFLDSKGGFYYEVQLFLFVSTVLMTVAQRWGDAPVHSIAVALFAGKNRIHFFDDIGYEHPPHGHCPMDEDKWQKGKCACDREKSFGDFVLCGAF